MDFQDVIDCQRKRNHAQIYKRALANPLRDNSLILFRSIYCGVSIHSICLYAYYIVYYNSLHAVEPLYKGISLIRMSQLHRTVYKTTPEMRTLNQDTLSCPKGIQNRGVPLYCIVYYDRSFYHNHIVSVCP